MVDAGLTEAEEHAIRQVALAHQAFRELPEISQEDRSKVLGMVWDWQQVIRKRAVKRIWPAIVED